MAKRYLGILGIIFVIILVSCVKNMDEAYIPSYIKIDKIDIATSGDQGSSSSNISDAWIYVNGADQGAYQLPAIIPLLSEGINTIKVAPGIKMNGVSTTRVPYPLVEPVEIEVNLIKDSIQLLNVECKYYETSKFAEVESFESNNVNFETVTNISSEWRRTNSDDPEGYVFDGNNSGVGILDTDTSKLVIVTKKYFEELPKNGLPVFVELNFKSNTTITVGLQSYTLAADGTTLLGGTSDFMYLNPSEEWKKIYINFTTRLSYDVNVPVYRFTFTAAGKNGDEPGVVLIDNFKVVYRDIN